MTQSDFQLAISEDGLLTVQMAPPIPIGSWSIAYVQTRRFGGENLYNLSGISQFSGMICKWASSGFNAVSGITIANSGAGIFNVNLWAADMSGQAFGDYAYRTLRTDSGAMAYLSQGYRIATP